MLETHLQQLAKELELEGSFATQVPGVFQFPLEEYLSVTLTAHSPGFSFSCSLGPIPKVKETEFFTRLLLGNLFCQGTKGSVLGLNEEGNQLTLTQDIGYNVDYKEFRDALEDFVNSVDFWHLELQNAPV